MLETANAVKWFLVSVLAMLACGFVLLYRKGRSGPRRSGPRFLGESEECPRSPLIASGSISAITQRCAALHFEVETGGCMALLGRQWRWQDYLSTHRRWTFEGG